jgi:hypothetical protein
MEFHALPLIAVNDKELNTMKNTPDRDVYT